MNDGRAGAAVMFVGEGEGLDAGVVCKDVMDGAAEFADAFAVDDAEFANILFLAELDVIEDDVLHVAGAKGVDGERDWVLVVGEFVFRYVHLYGGAIRVSPYAFSGASLLPLFPGARYE